MESVFQKSPRKEKESHIKVFCRFNNFLGRIVSLNVP